LVVEIFDIVVVADVVEEGIVTTVVADSLVV
jgi:hypothetical protein